MNYVPQGLVPEALGFCTVLLRLRLKQNLKPQKVPCGFYKKATSLQTAGDPCRLWGSGAREHLLVFFIVSLDLGQRVGTNTGFQCAFPPI